MSLRIAPLVPVLSQYIGDMFPLTNSGLAVSLKRNITVKECLRSINKEIYAIDVENNGQYSSQLQEIC